MVVRAKRKIEIAMKDPPKPESIESRPACGHFSPGVAAMASAIWPRPVPMIVSPSASKTLYMPVERIMNAVAEHTKSVSM